LAAKRSTQNGHSKLEDAIATLIQNQATFVAQLGENQRLHLQYERKMDERVEQIVRILTEHNRRIEQLEKKIELLTDAIHDKIGSKGQ
jgi:hemerythrin superfamily protein